MKSHDISRTKVNSEGDRSRVMLNKLCFDFRNAKRTYLGVSYRKVDEIKTKPDVQQTELSNSEGSGQVEHNRADVLKCNIDAGGAGDSDTGKTGQLVTGSAVQVDDGDSDRLSGLSDAAAAQLHLCGAATSVASELTDRNDTFSSVTTEYTQSADILAPNCSEPENKMLPLSDASSSSFVSSLVCESNKETDLSRYGKQARKPRWTGNNNNTAENKTAVRLADNAVLKTSSLPVNDPYSYDEYTEDDLHSASHNTVELSGSGRHSESSLSSRISSVVVYEDDLDDLPLSKRKSNLRSSSRVKKSLRSKGARSLYTMTATSNNDKTKCKRIKREVVRTPKRRRKIKSESEDEVWSTQKKLLLMPVDKKLKKYTSCSRKRNAGIRKDIFALLPKRKQRKSVDVKGMELPDLGVTYDADVAEMPDMLKNYNWESDVDNNTESVNVSRKWCMDITGADLTTDMDIDYERITENSNQQKSLICDKAAEQNLGQVMPQYPSDAECRHTNISSSQETPPPSVASDGFSSCDEPDHPERSSSGDKVWETHNSSSSRWLYINTMLAHYIDGRHFDRLVNGLSVQVPSTVIDEAAEADAQIGREYLCLSKLTKRDVKELQDQVRLEEIYHRRAKKVTITLHTSSNVRDNRSASLRHNVYDIVPRSTAKFAAVYQRSNDEGIETESANQRDASFDVDKELHQSAAETDDDTIPYNSSDSDEVVNSNNLISKPEGMCTGELLKGDVMESQEAGHSCINIDDGKQQESVCVSISRRSVAANKTQSQVPDQLNEPTPVSISLSNCIDSDRVAISGSLVSDDSHKAVSRHKSMKYAASLRKRKSSRPADNQPAAVNMCHAVTDAVIAVTDMSYKDAPSTGCIEYIAAVALASLSMATTSQLHSTCQSVPSESDASIETMLNRHQTNKDKKRSTDTTVVSKPAHKSSHHRQRKQFSDSKTVKETPLTKASDQTVIRNGHHVKDGHHVSADKHRDHTPKPADDLVSESTTATSEGHRSRSRRSHSGHQKQVAKNKEKSSTTHPSKSMINRDNSSSLVATSSMRKKHTEVSGIVSDIVSRKNKAANDKEKSPTIHPSKSTINRDNSSSRVATSSVHKKHTELSDIASDIVSRNNNDTASDKTRHRQHRSSSCRSSDKKVLVQKQEARSNLAGCDASTSRQTVVDADHNAVDVGVGRTDTQAKGETDDTITTFSADNSTGTSMLCTSLPSQASVLPQSSSEPNDVMCCGGIDGSSDKTISDIEAKALLYSQELNITTTPSSTSENPQKSGHEVLSGFNSNGTLQELCASFSATDKQHGDIEVALIISCNTDMGILTSAVDDEDAVRHSWSLARNKEETVYSEAINSLQSSVAVADYTPMSPTSPYRESEDIRSPSPMLADLEKNDRAAEIRSPSPCDIESPAALFRVVETSWDVKLTSPCEIQSPDCSEDEAGDSVEEFNRQCNVCFQHGPVTIPLTIEEASKTAHNQQLDMT